MQLDTVSLAIGVAATIGATIVVGISGAFLYYFFRLASEAKKKSRTKDHRRDLKLLRGALGELGFAHIGYFVLSLAIAFAMINTESIVPGRNFFVIAGMALFIWFVIVPGRGTLRLREMAREITVPSEPALPAPPQGEVDLASIKPAGSASDGTAADSAPASLEARAAEPAPSAEAAVEASPAQTPANAPESTVVPLERRQA